MYVPSKKSIYDAVLEVNDYPQMFLKTKDEKFSYMVDFGNPNTGKVNTVYVPVQIHWYDTIFEIGTKISHAFAEWCIQHDFNFTQIPVYSISPSIGWKNAGRVLARDRW